MLPASEASAPFGIRIATVGMCSNESGIESSRRFTFITAWGPTPTPNALALLCSRVSRTERHRGATPTPDALAPFFSARGDPTPARLARALRSLEPQALCSRVSKTERYRGATPTPDAL